MNQYDNIQDRSVGIGVISPIEKHTLIWGIFLVGMVVGFVSVYCVVAQPLMSRIETMQSELAVLHEDMESLVGAKEDVWQAGHLLSGIAAQKRQLADAQAALEDLKKLRRELQAEAGETAAAMASLADMARLQERLITQRAQTAAASEASGDMSRLLTKVVADHEIGPKASEAIADLAESKQGLEQLISLKRWLIQESEGIDVARAAANEMMAIKSALVAGADGVSMAKDVAGELVALKDDIVERSAGVSDAQIVATNVMAMKDELASGKTDVDAVRIKANKLLLLQDDLAMHEGDLSVAFTNLDGLLDMKTRLAGQTQAVAEAMQNFEILSDFQEEFAGKIQSLGSMRQTLTELILLETTVGRVAQVLQPLTQIGNVRRLSDKELREAARVILEQRSTRISNAADSEKPVTGKDTEVIREGDSTPVSVPEPIE